jgi:hypothetical protein
MLVYVTFMARFGALECLGVCLAKQQADKMTQSLQLYNLLKWMLGLMTMKARLGVGKGVR